MKITLLTIGKAKFDFVKDGIQFYKKRLQYFVNFSLVELQEQKFGKNISQTDLERYENEVLKKKFAKCSQIVLLDEKGKEFTSEAFANFIAAKVPGNTNLCFVIGGAYGFSNGFKQKYESVSLSKMTFPHDLVRLIFLEQLYRAFTILNGKKYHH